jgi:hypothetical protein
MILHDLWKYVKTSKIRIQTHAGLLIETYDTHKYMNATVEQIHYTNDYILITVSVIRITPRPCRGVFFVIIRV